MTEQEAINSARRTYWCALLRETRGNVALAAFIAGRNRTGAHQILRKLGIERGQFRLKKEKPRRTRWLGPMRCPARDRAAHQGIFTAAVR